MSGLSRRLAQALPDVHPVLVDMLPGMHVRTADTIHTVDVVAALPAGADERRPPSGEHPCGRTVVRVSDEQGALMPTDHDHPVDPARVAAARARLIDKDEASRLAGLLGLLADPTRARILYALDLVDELCVGDLALALEATEDSVGYALRVLRTAGLVSTRKDGRVVFYRLSNGFPEPLRDHCLRALVELSRTVADPDD